MDAKEFVTIAVDIGATSIRGALVDSLRDLPHEPPITLSTDRSHGAEGVVSQVRHVIEVLLDGCPSADVVGVSISSPGLVDTSQGKVRLALNLPDWCDIELAKLMRECFRVPVIVENDANAGALGEWYYVFRRQIDSMIFVTISTGIGAGIIESGKLLRGASGAAGELGHMSIDYEGPACHECKRSKGCLTTLASGTAIMQYARSRVLQATDSVLWDLCKGKLEDIDGPVVEHAARLGDDVALAAYDRAARALGQGLVNVIHLLDPQVIVLGGGVLAAGHLFLDRLLEIVGGRLLDGKRVSVIREASLGSVQGIAGAAVNGFIHWELME